MTEEELQDCLQRVVKGDQQAFTLLHNRIRQQVYGTVSLLVNRQADVADVVNEIYIELFRCLPQYDGKRPFGAWLNGMIVRQCSNWNRRSWRRLRLMIRSRENEERNMMVQVSTGSPEVTREMLLKVAKGLR